MEIIKKIEYLEVPNWALCYLVNSDSSGLTEEEIALVDKWWKLFTDECEKLGCWDVVFSIDTYQKEFDKQKELVVEYAQGLEDLWDISQLKREVLELEDLAKIKDENKEAYFSHFPCFGLPCNVNDCTIVYLK